MLAQTFLIHIKSYKCGFMQHYNVYEKMHSNEKKKVSLALVQFMDSSTCNSLHDKILHKFKLTLDNCTQSRQSHLGLIVQE